MKEILGERKKIKILVAVGFVFLLAGKGASEGLLRLAGSKPVNLLQKVGAQETPLARAPQGLPDFVPLVKKLKPVVVNISTTQVSKETQIFPSPFGENDPFS